MIYPATVHMPTEPVSGFAADLTRHLPRHRRYERDFETPSGTFPLGFDYSGLLAQEVQIEARRTLSNSGLELPDVEARLLVSGAFRLARIAAGSRNLIYDVEVPPESGTGFCFFVAGTHETFVADLGSGPVRPGETYIPPRWVAVEERVFAVTRCVELPSIRIANTPTSGLSIQLSWSLQPDGSWQRNDTLPNWRIMMFSVGAVLRHWC